MRWNTICFDLDNTLYSHEDAFKRAISFCFHSIFEERNINYSNSINEIFTTFKENCDKYWNDYENGTLTPKEYRRKRFLQTIDQFNLSLNESDADKFHEHYEQVVDDFSEPYPFLYQLMEVLKGAGIKIGIITNGKFDTQYSKINKLNLGQWIPDDCIFISAEVKLSKPDPKIFNLAKVNLKSKAGCLFIGDSWDHDVVGALEAGWDAIFLNTRNETPTSSHIPFATVKCLKNVLEIIVTENRLKG
ncbi:hypothetical protein BKP45_05810 [Anaerobacillus alkalidiazotrophicus]|uniref:HAD family hydrolase n=1 Tax=Anaerobacillus alkalidiazotrophicus TaxID=472963 RepID=A0A1S2MES0_9BACI|nr:HAD family hydrolase [Anaerobacillus alkalidiazotrophicus]OIJ22185.1 hypothetical protein BKP45_05810 [Anaerobacillus alkalidiazotrophicus]